MNTSFALVKIHMEMAKYDIIIVAKFLFIVIMINGLFCANSLLQLSSLSDLIELRSALIVKCVFSSSLSYTAIMLNIMTMYHMQKASSLPIVQ